MSCKLRVYGESPDRLPLPWRAAMTYVIQQLQAHFDNFQLLLIQESMTDYGIDGWWLRICPAECTRYSNICCVAVYDQYISVHASDAYTTDQNNSQSLGLSLAQPDSVQRICDLALDLLKCHGMQVASRTKEHDDESFQG